MLAKVTRDRLMLEFDRQFPEYGFAGHKGYGTARHLAAIAAHGPCPIHRRSFAPLKAKEPEFFQSSSSSILVLVIGKIEDEDEEENEDSTV